MPEVSEDVEVDAPTPRPRRAHTMRHPETLLRTGVRNNASPKPTRDLPRAWNQSNNRTRNVASNVHRKERGKKCQNIMRLERARLAPRNDGIQKENGSFTRMRGTGL